MKPDENDGKERDMRAKYDMLKQKTRAEFSDADRKALGKAVEVLTNLQVCEQADGGALAIAESTVDQLGAILGSYPVPARQCDESKAKRPSAATKPKGDS